MQITFLGTGAPLHPTRRAMGLLLHDGAGGSPLLIDTCGGFELAHALHEADQPAREIKHAVVTHRHGDHIGGAMPLLLFAPGLQYHGPRDALNAVDQLITLTYPHLSEPASRKPNYHELPERQPVEINGYTVTAYPVDHRVPTLAVRVERGGRVLAFSADCLPCDSLVECARDADLFVCDALCEDAKRERAVSLKHPTSAEAAEMANQANARKLALVHSARFADEDAMQQEARAIFKGPVVVPDDGERIDQV